MASLLALAALMLAPLPAKDPPVLDAIFAFDDPAHCVPSPVFRQILDAWAVPTARNGWELGKFTLPRGYEDVLAYSERPHGEMLPMITEMWGNNGRHDVLASIRGNWHGLAVDYISVWTGPPSDGPMIEIGFDAGPDRVAAILSEMGLPPMDGRGSGASHRDGTPYPRLSCRFR